MKTNREKMIERFNQVKRLGWVTSHRANNTGIGKTFEDLVVMNPICSVLK